MSSTKRKLLISSLLLIFVTIGVFGMVSVVFALTNQTIKTQVSLNFESTKDVYAEIEGGLFVNNTKQEGSDIDMTVEGENETGNFTLNNIVIKDEQEDKVAQIDINIKNTLPSESNTPLYVTPTLNQTVCNNMVLTKLVSFEDVYNYEAFTENNVCIMPEQTAYISFKFEVEDLAYDAEFGGEINVLLASSHSRPADAGTSTIAGVGHYPQNYVGSDMAETLAWASATEILTATGNTYTAYLKDTLVTLNEYSYEGLKYAKLESSLMYEYANQNQKYLEFSTGDSVSSGREYYFYVSPIKVSAKENRTIDGTNKIIWLTKSLMSGCTLDGNVWANQTTSGVRPYLNETFLAESGISATAITIKNDKASGNSTDYDDTTDALWLPSSAEYLAWFSTYESRRAKPTDLALASYTDYVVDKNAGYCYTRSYNDDSSINLNGNPSLGVSADGGIYGYAKYNSHFGIRFAFAM